MNALRGGLIKSAHHAFASTTGESAKQPSGLHGASTLHAAGVRKATGVSDHPALATEPHR